MNLKLESRTVSQATVFAALIAACEILPLDIPVPILGVKLTLDPTGIPIFLSTMLFGASVGILNVLVAGLVISMRNIVSGFMKALAELSTIALYPITKDKPFYPVACVLLRVVVMSIACLIVLPAVYGVPRAAVISMLPAIGIFNTIQGGLNIAVSVLIHRSVRLWQG